VTFLSVISAQKVCPFFFFASQSKVGTSPFNALSILSSAFSFESFQSN